MKRLDNEGFFARQEWGYANFIAPCVYRASTEPLREEDKDSITSEKVNAETNMYYGLSCFRFTSLFCLPNRIVLHPGAIEESQIVIDLYMHPGQPRSQ